MTNLKICLINPITIYYSSIRNDNVTDSQKTLPYLGLGYVASVLEKHNYKVDIIECTFKALWGKELREHLEGKGYDVFGVSLFDYNYKNAIKIIRIIKEINPTSFIFVGGMYATMEYDKILSENNEIDCCVIGEGEYTALDIIRSIENEYGLDLIEGIALRNGNEIIRTKPRKLIEKLDLIPFPKRAFDNPMGKVQIKTSRGCENHCLYCATSSFLGQCSGQKLRFRSPQNIIDEIIEIKSLNSDIKRIFFIDDSFLSIQKNHEEWLLEFCNLLMLKQINLPFDIYARAKGIIKHKNILPKLLECGLSSVFIGVESFLDDQLKYYNKRTTVLENLEALQIIKDYEIDCEIGFIPLHHNITIDQVYENYQILKSSPVVNLSVNVKAFSQNRAVIALNGTPIKKLLIKANKFVDNEIGYNFESPQVQLFFNITKIWGRRISKVLSRTYLPEFTKSIHQDLYKESIKISREFTRLDIDFVLEICEMIINGNEVVLSSIIDNYSQQLELIIIKLDALENKCRAVINERVTL